MMSGISCGVTLSIMATIRFSRAHAAPISINTQGRSMEFLVSRTRNSRHPWMLSKTDRGIESPPSTSFSSRNVSTPCLRHFAAIRPAICLAIQRSLYEWLMNTRYLCPDTDFLGIEISLSPGRSTERTQGQVDVGPGADGRQPPGSLMLPLPLGRGHTTSPGNGPLGTTAPMCAFRRIRAGARPTIAEGAAGGPGRRA